MRRTSWIPGLSTGRRIDNPAAYAHTVLIRHFLSHNRRRSSGERPTYELPETPAPTRDGELRLVMLHGLSQLPARDRAVLVLRYWEDRSIEETADILRSTPGAVRTRSSRALARLRTLLGDQLSELATA